MKKFNKVITVEVDVDDIASQLLATISPEFKHREILASAVIGSLLNSGSGSLSFVYGALNGFTGEVDFQVGDLVHCTESGRRLESGKYSDNMIGQCTIIEIDIYRTNKLRVQWTQPVRHAGSKPDTETVNTWVDHRKCSRLPGSEMEQAELNAIFGDHVEHDVVVDSHREPDVVQEATT